jgi:putative CocE/NonD family hydrolase
VESYGPVHLYENGTGRWVRQRYYPRRDLAHSRLYLSPGGLGSAPPAAASVQTGSGPPVNGLCSRNTVQWTAGLFPPGQPCETDNRAFEAGALTYTTPAMDKPLHIQGPIGLTLRGSTTAKDATWVAVLSDVDESGKSTQLTAGWLLSSRRAVDEGRSVRSKKGDLVVPFHPFTQESLLPVKPDDVETLNIEIFNTDAVIKPGHSLRLTIAQGDVPHMPAPAPSLVDGAGGRSSVHIDPANPSFLTLPAVRRR